MLRCFDRPQPAGQSREPAPPRDEHTITHCAKADRQFHRQCAAGATHDELGALELLQDQGLHGDGAQVGLPHRELAARLVRQHPPQLDGAPGLRLIKPRNEVISLGGANGQERGDLCGPVSARSCQMRSSA